jgi:hypothetical protein
LALPETDSPAVSSSILVALEIVQSLPARFDVGSVMMGSLSSPEFAQIASVGVEENTVQIGSAQIVPETLLTSSEFTQTVPMVVEEAPDLIDLGQISPKNTQTATVGVAGEKGMLQHGFLLNLPSSELAQIVSMGSSFSPKPYGLVDASERSKSTLVLAVPKAQLLVNGLSESQAWYLGWLRDGTRSHELLAIIDCFEEQTRRNNKVAPPPICPM